MAASVTEHLACSHTGLSTTPNWRKRRRLQLQMPFTQHLTSENSEGIHVYCFCVWFLFLFYFDPCVFFFFFCAYFILRSSQYIFVFYFIWVILCELFPSLFGFSIFCPYYSLFLTWLSCVLFSKLDSSVLLPLSRPYLSIKISTFTLSSFLLHSLMYVRFANSFSMVIGFTWFKAYFSSDLVECRCYYGNLFPTYWGLSCQVRATQQDNSQMKLEEVSIPTDAQITIEKHEKHREARQHDYSGGSKLQSY